MPRPRVVNAPDAEPNVLPRGMAPLNLAYFCVTVCDFALAGGMVAQWAAAADASGFSVIIGVVLGFELALVFQVFPPGGLRGRNMVALRAYRVMLWLLLAAHLPLLAAAGLEAWLGGGAGRAAVWLALPGAVFASAGLYPIARALRGMRWLDPKARPEDFEPLVGLDEAAPAATSLGRMSLFTAFLLPFLPAIRAGRILLAAAASLIWLAGLVAIWVSPAGAILPVALFLIILWQQSVYKLVYGGGAPLLFAPELPAPARAARRAGLNGIFTPSRLHLTPLPESLGRLALPVLLLLDYFGLASLIALQTAGAFAPFLADIGAAGLALVPVMMVALVPLMSVIARGGKAVYAVIGAIAAIVEMALALLAAAASFHIAFGSIHVTVPPPVYPVIWPLTWLLLAGLALAVVVLVSLRARAEPVGPK